MRLIFAGTPSVAVSSLLSLIESDHEIVAVISREDAPLGRKRVLTPSPVAHAAEERGIPVLKANRLTAEMAETVRALNADLGVIVAYGGLVREPLLSTPRLGWINLHFSLLPAWRGAAPVQRSLIAGDTVTGASVFQLVPALDAGDVFGTVEHQVSPDVTAGALLDELAAVGSDLLVSVVDDIATGTAVALPQSGEVTLAPKLTLDDGRLDWSEDAGALYSRIRGVTPEPGAHTTIGGARFKILEANPRPELTLQPGELALHDKVVLIGTGSTALELVSVQPAGKSAMRAADWWRGLGPDPRIVAE
ncbi:methionyl-tRNA formyltransferase [Mycetocola zhadangensis]|uniref:Methionyl-tRNA formyltransferase n=1 Tax=Mycetocola zhadangensis TaxID=1164595 RepID=A0A3L7J9J3_9MICO|nr:methionyl-tRNA formyltransferase [Mycetocola zhadangensis]RLQ86131.1 methionyl-tRNA formyltransferase [Mycetocola zhadangensis]GGE88633.1 methionyl-tRNA formyltransferase [Mycetocola zhadangensis]